jgi:hypothetical protein
MSYEEKYTRFTPKGYDFIGFSMNGDNEYWKYKLKSNMFNTITPIKGAKIIYYLPKKNKYYNEELENLDINNKLYDGLEEIYQNEKYSTLFGGKLTKKFKAGKRKTIRKSYTRKSYTRKSYTRKSYTRKNKKSTKKRNY